MSITATAMTDVTETSFVTAADQRTDLVALLAAGVLRLAAERAGVERKRMRTPEPRSQSIAITPSISSRYDLLSTRGQSVYAGQTGRPARRGAGAGDGAQRVPSPAAAKAADTGKGASR